MLLNSLAFLIGVLLLGYGADYLVKGAATIAIKCQIPKFVAGLTLVALGTSAPELFLNLIAAAKGETGIALANVSGSNLANVCVGFGACALIGTVVIRRADFLVDLVLLVLAPLVVLAAFYTNTNRLLPYWSAAILCALLMFYLFSLRSRSAADDEVQITASRMSAGIGFFALGVVLLYSGGELVLWAALGIADRLGINEEIIGLTIVAVGTSIPDVTASIVATRKKEYGIATGNLLGSNISNILLVLNGTILVSGGSLATLPPTRLDYAVVGFTSFICFFAAWKTESISKAIGISLLVIYFAYISCRVWAVVLESHVATTSVAWCV